MDEHISFVPSCKIIGLVFICRDRLDKFNIQFEETSVYARVHSDTTLNVINTIILSRLGLDENEELTYSNDGITPIDTSISIHDLGYEDSDEILVYSSKGRMWTSREQRISEEISRAAIIHIVCETRIGSDTDTLRTIKVAVNPSHFCHDMLEEVSTLLGRTGLKLKSKRVVLRGGGVPIKLPCRP